MEHVRRRFEPPQRQITLSELDEGREIDPELKAPFLKRNNEWLLRYNKARPLCLYAAFFFAQLTKEQL